MGVLTVSLFEFLKSVDSFFFDYTISTTFLSYFRILVTSFILIDFIYLRKDILSHITPEGLYPFKNYIKKYKEGIFFPYSLFSISQLGKSKLFSYIIYYLFYVFAAASVLGVFTKFSMVGLFITYACIQNRAITIWSTAGDQVIKLLLLCLIFTDCSAKFSIDYLLNAAQPENYSNGWSIRFFQVYLSWIYFNAGVAKSKDSLWQNGEGLKYAALNPGWGNNLKNIKSKFLRESVYTFFNSKFAKIINYAIMLMQFCAPLFLWLKDTKLIYLLILASFHLGILVFLRLNNFGPLMIVSLFSFLDYLFK